MVERRDFWAEFGSQWGMTMHCNVWQLPRMFSSQSVLQQFNWHFNKDKTKHSSQDTVFFFQNAHYVAKLMRFLQASVGNLLVIETTRSDRLTYKKECWWNVALSSKHAAKVIYAYLCMFMHVHACSSLPRYKGWCGTKSRINLPTGSNVSTTSAHSAPYQIVWALAVRSYPFSRKSKSTEVPGIQNSIPDCFKMLLHSPGSNTNGCCLWLHT